jgi:ATP-binding cassette subfamily B protein
MEHKRKVAPPIEVLRRYVPETLKHPWLLAATLVGSVGIQVASLASPWYMRQFFNLLATTEKAGDRQQFIYLIIMIVIISLAGWAMRRLRGWSQVYLEAMVMNGLSQSAFEYVMQHSAHFFSSQFSGTLTRRISKYKDAYEALFDALTMSFLPLFIFIVGATCVLFIRNHTLGEWFAVAIFISIYLQFKATALRQPLRDIRATEDSNVVGTLADAISNHNTVTLFSGSRHEGTLFRTATERWRSATIRSWIADENIWTIQGLLMIVINIGMLSGTYYFWSRGELMIGDFVLIQAYIITGFDQIANMNRDLRRVYDAFADGGEIVAILNDVHDIKDAHGAKAFVVDRGNIAFNDVSFYFHEERSILNNMSVTIRGGQKVALVGPSGAGKSTITKLLLRLYDIKQGTITIDDQNIAEVTQDSLREKIGFVPQEPILFHRSLMENIRYGKRNATDEEVIEAAKKAHCHEFISKLSSQYDTLVGERGIKLSGGERQRVAIARAILKNAPILVLDEATSSLDSESELYIQESLAMLMQGKTVLVIAHRLSTIMNMDRILVINHGAVVADDTHAQLLKQDGLYQKLWNIQAGGFIPEVEEEE